MLSSPWENTSHGCSALPLLRAVLYDAHLVVSFVELSFDLFAMTFFSFSSLHWLFSFCFMCFCFVAFYFCTWCLPFAVPLVYSLWQLLSDFLSYKNFPNAHAFHLNFSFFQVSAPSSSDWMHWIIQPYFIYLMKVWAEILMVIVTWPNGYRQLIINESSFGRVRKWR